MAGEAPIWKQFVIEVKSPSSALFFCLLNPSYTMLQSPSLLWSTFTTLVTLARSTALFTNKSLTCHSDCSLDEGTASPVEIFAWASYNDFANSNAQEVDGTVTSSATIVTLVNTVLDATGLLTEYPPNYLPPATNAEGTRVTTITYTRFSTTYITVLAYPTPFVWWPDVYGWAGTLQVGSKCEIVADTTFTTLSISSAPQPTNSADLLAVYQAFASLTDLAVFSEDPEGLSYSVIIDGGNYWEFTALSDLFPDQPALGICSDGDSGPDWGGFTQTLWNYTTASTTSYVGAGGGGPSKSPPPSPTPPPTPTPPPSPTPIPSPTLSKSAKEPNEPSQSLGQSIGSNPSPNPSLGSSTTGGISSGSVSPSQGVSGSGYGSSGQETSGSDSSGPETSSLEGEGTGTVTGGTTPTPSQVVFAGKSTSYRSPFISSLLLLCLWVLCSL
ncbi:hypothetical protein NA56DRAFT_690293 [Hyaloscypha hepaticicola]|uniref:Uncharacterized protein n=1 Tax=Hyaloscypha hepaticicola TaxID=2082293 RepID=A0A2J6Q0H2_9HELO|nr:hypothetical protein NA56DRAFT_690293 [Hyaloscypha hepaticicola]